MVLNITLKKTHLRAFVIGNILLSKQINIYCAETYYHSPVVFSRENLEAVRLQIELWDPPKS